VLIVPTIATPLKIANLVYQAVEQLPYLQGSELAHPITHSSDFEIAVLIGADFYWQVVEDKIFRGNGPTAVQLKLGYLLSGTIPPSLNSTTDLNVFHAVAQPVDNCTAVPKFWEVESVGTLSCNEPPPMQLISIKCRPDGSYIVKFPWKEHHPSLPSNCNICEG